MGKELYSIFGKVFTSLIDSFVNLRRVTIVYERNRWRQKNFNEIIKSPASFGGEAPRRQIREV